MVPVKLLAGVKVNVPFGLMTTLPWLGSATTALAMVSGSPSTSVSLASTATVTAALMGVEAMSLTATGASLTGVIESVSVAACVSRPSVTV